MIGHQEEIATRPYWRTITPEPSVPPRAPAPRPEEGVSSRRDLTPESTDVERFISAIEKLWGTKSFRWRSQVAHRLFELRRACLEENVPLSSASIEQFVRFVRENPLIGQPSLIITDTGNLRASWSPEADRHFAIEFLGGSNVAFVIFAPRKSARTARVAGSSEAMDLILLRAAQMGVDWVGEHP